MTAASLLILPLALDTFVMSSAIGLQRPTGRQRARVTLLFAAFEGGMPLVGALAGRLVGSVAGRDARWLAVAVLVVAGLAMLLRRDDDEGAAARLLTASGWVQVGLGLSVSVDELAIGFSLGLLGLPLWLACVLIAAQAIGATQLGLSVGRRIGQELRENAERAAGVVLLGLALLTALTG